MDKGEEGCPGPMSLELTALKPGSTLDVYARPSITGLLLCNNRISKPDNTLTDS